MSEQVQTTHGASCNARPAERTWRLACKTTKWQDRLAASEVGEAVLSLDHTGRYVDADEAALELLGVSLAELLASPPDRFTIEPSDAAEQASLRGEWATSGSRPLVGTAGLRRADGQTIRVSFAIEPAGAGFRARLSPIQGSPVAPSTGYTVASLMREWRDAERKLAELVPGTPAWARTKTEIEMLRDRYQELFRSLAHHEEGPTGSS
jgi:PAS domain-containing protein